MAFTDALYDDVQPIWEAQHEHPFVLGIGDGSLDENIFKRWVLQDYLYLKEFARIFAWAAAKSPRLEAMRWYAGVLDLTLNTEMDLHRTYAARFDLTPEELEAETMWPTTRAYTDFLVRTAAGGDMAELLSAPAAVLLGLRRGRTATGGGRAAGGSALCRLDCAVRLGRVCRSRRMAQRCAKQPGRVGLL